MTSQTGQQIMIIRVLLNMLRRQTENEIWSVNKK